MSQAEFDRYASSYETDLARSLAVTGEERDFYAQGRIDWTAKRVARLRTGIRAILDYGCGDGRNAPLLASTFKAERVLGVDVAGASIEIARQTNQSAGVCFQHVDEWEPNGTMDLGYCNGVFHHIAPNERQGCLLAIRRALRPGGLFALWENNPWNPGTRYVMSQCAFDENAITIPPPEGRRLLADAGFEILSVDSLFYFPRQLSFLRFAERWLHSLPLGGQYLILCRKPVE